MFTTLKLSGASDELYASVGSQGITLFQDVKKIILLFSKACVSASEIDINVTGCFSEFSTFLNICSKPDVVSHSS